MLKSSKEKTDFFNNYFFTVILTDFSQNLAIYLINLCLIVFIFLNIKCSKTLKWKWFTKLWYQRHHKIYTIIYINKIFRIVEKIKHLSYKKCGSVRWKYNNISWKFKQTTEIIFNFIFYGRDLIFLHEPINFVLIKKKTKKKGKGKVFLKKLKLCATHFLPIIVFLISQLVSSSCSVFTRKD